jgi:hypothetical protein
VGEERRWGGVGIAGGPAVAQVAAAAASLEAAKEVVMEVAVMAAVVGTCSATARPGIWRTSSRKGQQSHTRCRTSPYMWTMSHPCS